MATPSLQAAYDWAYNICNNNATLQNTGYSQAHRNQETIGGITYYDCSSFVWYALKAGGFDVEGVYGTYPFVTANMGAVLLQLGFVEYDASNGLWSKGDIMWVNGHTEIVYDPLNYRTMGAHSDVDQYGNPLPISQQVSLGTYNNHSYFTKGYYYPLEELETYHWQAQAYGAFTRTGGAAIGNAVLTYRELASRGWTLNAVCGLLGNIGFEGQYNPWRWQYDIISTPVMTGTIGYGLTQFTPSGKYILDTRAQVLPGYNPNYLNHEGSPEDGHAQIVYIDLYADYASTTAYPISYANYKTTNLSAEDCATIWLYNYERPQEPIAPPRQAEARYWYDLLFHISADTPVPPPPPPPPPTTRRKSPFWVFIYPF